MLAISVVLFAWLLVSTIGSRTREGNTNRAAQQAAKINKSAKTAVSKVVAAKSAVAAKPTKKK